MDKESQINDLLSRMKVRRSRRAKRLQLRVSLKHGLEVVVPHRMSQREAQLRVPSLLWEKRFWLWDKSRRIQQLKSEANLSLPHQLVLPSIDTTVLLRYGDQPTAMTTSTSTAAMTTSVNATASHPRHQTGLKATLHHAVQADTHEGKIKALRELLRREAKHIYPLWLDEIASKMQIDYQRLTVRGQKTRWGSCSARGNINLNYLLLFFPENVVKSVMVHELAHRRHMNHSADFWQLVSCFDPDYQTHNAALKKAPTVIPDCFMLS